MDTEATGNDAEDASRRYVRRTKKLASERARQKKHGRTLLDLDRLEQKRAREAARKSSARKKAAERRRGKR